MMSEKPKRSEILFYYDIKDGNPNGDPLDENKPRIDTETNRNMVSDVRIKRTIRDYFIEYEGYDDNDDKSVLIREIKDDKGKLQDMKQRASSFGKNKGEIKENILKKCIDVRLFGGTVALKKDDKSGESITLTGPVQFNMLNHSKHKVSVKPVGHSFTMASGEGKTQGSLATEYIVPYSFIEVYGIINEKAAEHTHLTVQDIHEMCKAMWEGTRNIISRTKFGQVPRLLIKVNYKDDGFYIGDIGKHVRLDTEKYEEEIRSVGDFKLDVSSLVNTIKDNKDKIESIDMRRDPDLRLNDAEMESGKIEGITVYELKW